MEKTETLSSFPARSVDSDYCPEQVRLRFNFQRRKFQLQIKTSFLWL